MKYSEINGFYFTKSNVPPCGGGRCGPGFVLRPTSVSPLDRDKDILSLTREKCSRIFPFLFFFLFFFV